MIYSTKRTILSLLIVSGIVACAKSESNETEISGKLKLGRKIFYSDTVHDVGLSLSDSNIYATTRDQETNALVSVLFDTNTQQEVDYFSADHNCLQTAEKHANELIIEPSELSPNERLLQRINPTIFAVTYNRAIGVKPVRNAFFQCIYVSSNDGKVKLSEIINRTFGGHAFANSASETAEFSPIAQSSGRTLAELSRRAIIFPKIASEGPESGKLQLWHATEFVASDIASKEQLTITVASDSGEVLEAYSNQYAAVYTVKSEAFDRTYLNSNRVPVALPLLEVKDGDATIRADIDGEIDVATIGNALSVRLQSPRIQVVDAAVNDTLIMTIPATVNNDGEIKLNPDASGLIGLNAFSAILRINEFVRRYLEPSQVSFLNQSITLQINVTGSCNAFYNGGISMFKAGNGCENTALINDTMYHEWGHGLDNFTGTNQGITDGAFSEGIGDIVSGYFTNDPNLAPGFITGQIPGIRNLKNTRRYPNDQGEVHVEGQIIGGAFWDMRVELIKKYGNDKGAFRAGELFFLHLLTTDSYLDSYAAVLRLDDDDNNPATKSPNHCLINAAFSAHGLATAENCSDAPVSASYGSGGLMLALESGKTGSFLASGKGVHYVHVCYGDKTTCVLSGKVDQALVRNGTIGDLNIFSSQQNQTLSANTLVTMIGSDEYGKIIGARTFKIVNR